MAVEAFKGSRGRVRTWFLMDRNDECCAGAEEENLTYIYFLALAVSDKMALGLNVTAALRVMVESLQVFDSLTGGGSSIKIRRY